MWKSDKRWSTDSIALIEHPTRLTVDSQRVHHFPPAFVAYYGMCPLLAPVKVISGVLGSVAQLLNGLFKIEHTL